MNILNIKMKKYLLVVFIFVVISTFAGEPLELKVMSFNIRNGKAKDGENHWDKRKDYLCETLKKYDADLVGLQEAYRFQLDYILKKLSIYAFVGEGRDGGKAGEYSAILYKKSSIKALDSGTFWLSDTPEKPSVSFGNSYRRICTWGHFQDVKKERSFFIYNTHYDHKSQNSREKSSDLIIQKIQSRKQKDTFVLMGDFNAGENNPAIAKLKRSPFNLLDSFRVIHPNEKEVGTFSGFQNKTSGAKIDYVFVPDGIKVKNAAIERDQKDGRNPSDHYAVSAVLQINEK